MASWVVFALLYPLFYSFTNFIDKYILVKRVQNIYSYAIASGLVLGSFAAVTLMLRPLQRASPPVVALAMLSGLLFACGVITFLKALQAEEVSRVISLIHIAPVFTAVSAYLILHEELVPYFPLALLAMVAGAVLISVKDIGWHIFRVSRVEGFILFAALIWGVDIMVDKIVLASLPYWNLFSIAFLTYGGVLGSFLFFKASRDGFIRMVRDRSFFIIAFNESIAMCAIILYLAALSLTKASYAAAFGSLQPLYVLAIAVLLSVFLPRFYEESHTARQIAVKVVATLLIVGGAAALAFGQ